MSPVPFDDGYEVGDLTFRLVAKLPVTDGIKNISVFVVQIRDSLEIRLQFFPVYNLSRFGIHQSRQFLGGKYFVPLKTNAIKDINLSLVDSERQGNRFVPWTSLWVSLTTSVTVASIYPRSW